MMNAKSLALFTILLLSVTIVKAISHEQQKTDSCPNDNLGQYQIQSCCPQGYNVAG